MSADLIDRAVGRATLLASALLEGARTTLECLELDPERLKLVDDALLAVVRWRLRRQLRRDPSARVRAAARMVGVDEGQA